MKVLRFNQDASCCIVSSTDGAVNIYNCDPFGKCFDMNEREGDVEDTGLGQKASKRSDFIAEMLFSTSLIAIANKRENSRKLKVVNTKRNSTICELLFPDEVMDVRMNRKIMCVLLRDDQIYIYDISCMKLLKQLKVWDEDLKNIHSQESSVEDGVTSIQQAMAANSATVQTKIALSTDDASILCFSTGSADKKQSQNDILVYDAINLRSISYLKAVHKSSVACLAISDDGQLIASASTKGTVIRVFNSHSSALSQEFRRGNRPCTLQQVLFNSTSSLVGCVGNTDTIHIFKLMQASQQDSGNKTKPLDKYIPKGIRATMHTQTIPRDHANIPLPKSNSGQFHMGFPREFSNQVYVAGDEGTFSIFTLPSTPGSCTLTKTSKF